MYLKPTRIILEWIKILSLSLEIPGSERRKGRRGRGGSGAVLSSFPSAMKGQIISMLKETVTWPISLSYPVLGTGANDERGIGQTSASSQMLAHQWSALSLPHCPLPSAKVSRLGE